LAVFVVPIVVITVFVYAAYFFYFSEGAGLLACPLLLLLQHKFKRDI